MDNRFSVAFAGGVRRGARAVTVAAIAAALALVVALGAGCAPYSDRPIDPQTGIRNFAKVSDTLYRGGQPDVEGYFRLMKMGIRTVISLRTLEADRRVVETLGLRYIHISFKTGHPEDEDVLEFLKAATDPVNQPVFVCCHWGADRTGMMVAVYRMVVQGWTREAALREMYDMGYHPGWDDIREYVEHLDVERVRSKLRGS